MMDRTVIEIGMDVEFMAYKGKKQVFPIDNDILSYCGCDEFGHCIEIRPTQSNNKRQLLFNVMSEMADLPDDFQYKADNCVTMPKKEFFRLLKSMGTKEIAQCQNIYGLDILDEPDISIDDSMRRAYCGMHVHVSKHIVAHTSEDGTVIKEGVDIPAKALTYLFDEHIFSILKVDEYFNMGKYRQPGFYEVKDHSHFEYRSLGVSAFTPKRVGIIFDIMKLITENSDTLILHDLLICKNKGVDIASTTQGYESLYKELVGLKYKLQMTKETKGNLKSLWVRW